MKKKMKSNTIKRIIFISILLIILFTSGVFASKAEFNNVIIKFSNGLEMDVRTTKTDIKEILKENNILVLEDEIVIPADTLDFTKTIRIKKADEVVDEKEQLLSLQYDEIASSYGNVTEKIITKKIEIPFKTINRTADAYSSNNMSVIIQTGEKGLKETKYRVKYNNKVEVSKTEISSKIIKEPVDKIVQLVPNVISRGASRDGSLAGTAANRKGTPMEVNATAYCPCEICCGKTNAITANGSRAQSYYTIAAPSSFPFGTIMYIDYFKDSPSNGWYIVQDRGGAITDNRIDLFYDTHGEALQFGRKYLDAVVYFP